EGPALPARPRSDHGVGPSPTAAWLKECGDGPRRGGSRTRERPIEPRSIRLMPARCEPNGVTLGWPVKDLRLEASSTPIGAPDVTGSGCARAAPTTVLRVLAQPLRRWGRLSRRGRAI